VVAPAPGPRWGSAGLLQPIRLAANTTTNATGSNFAFFMIVPFRDNARPYKWEFI
jgi:hypothetical protein